MKITKLSRTKIKIEHSSLSEPLEIDYQQIFLSGSPKKTEDGKYEIQMILMDQRNFFFIYDSLGEAQSAFELLSDQVLQ
jgi:hypothetical protein